MGSYLGIANSIPMWIACGLAVALCIVQAIIFAKKSYKSGLEMGLTTEQMKGAMRSSMIASLGPSLVILIGMLSLLISMGGPMAWMRLSFIGSVMFETMAAGIGANAVGETLSANMSETAFATAVWTMILGSIGWIIFATLTADKMDKVTARVAKGAGGAVLASAAIVGAFGAQLPQYLLGLDNRTLALIGGFATMSIINPLATKKDIRWLKEWGLAIALIIGLLLAALIPQFKLR